MRLIRRQRVLGAVIAVAYAIGYLLVFAHFAAERHIICIEHQTAHHGSHDHIVEAELQVGMHAAPTAEDDHCELMQMVRCDAQFDTPSPASPNLVLATEHHQVHAAPLSDWVQLALWRYAPKQSPPNFPV